MPTPYPDNKSEVRDLVRGLTMYDNTPDELPQSDLDTHIQVAQMRLTTKTGSESFYSDEGLGQALVGMTAILAKAAVENYSVDGWDIAEANIDVSGAGDEDNAQFHQWATLVAEGIASSNKGGAQSATNINSASYVGR